MRRKYGIRFRAGILPVILALFCWQPALAASSDDLFQELKELRQEVEKRREQLRHELLVIQEEEAALAQKKEALQKPPTLAAGSGEEMVQTSAAPSSDLVAELELVKSQVETLTANMQQVKTYMAQGGMDRKTLLGGVPSQQRRGDWSQLTAALSVGGSIRLRNELKDDFNFNKSMQDYLLTQFRLHARWAPASWFTAFVEGQDARVFGEDPGAAPAINRDAVPNIFADDFDLHQGYIDWKFAAGSVPVKIRTGRQKFNLGAKRLVASLEWVNTARVWDGVRLTLGTPKERTLEAMASRLVPVDPEHLNDYDRTGSRMFNSYFHNLYYTDWQLVPHTQTEAYWMLRRESDIDDQVHTLGLRLASKFATWDANAEVATQFGEFGGLDHRAFAAHIGAGHKIASLNNARLGLAYNFGSGDDDPEDGDHKTFDNQYPLNHAYYGYMDFFSLQNMHNLEATFNTKIGKKLALRLGYQNFWLAQEDDDAWYNAGAGVIRRASEDVASHVGSELDFTVKRPFGSLALELGYSRFFPGSYIKDIESRQDANFVYLQPKFTF